MNSYRIGIDGGGTKTRALVLNDDLEILGAGASGSSNIYSVGLDKAIENILDSADFALAQSGLNRAQVARWGLGLGGISSPSQSATVENGLRGFLGAEAKICVVEDVIAAHRGAFPDAGATAQILCIAGTGSNCFGRNSRGEVAKSDGLGPILGDRGSGYRIGEAALRQYGLEADGVKPATTLSPAILAHFGAQNTTELIQIVYAPSFERSHMASLAPLVVELAAHNPSARVILENAGFELARTARAVLARLGTQNGEVALVGGVLSGAQVVRLAFEKELGDDVKLVEANFESAIGAALIAR